MRVQSDPWFPWEPRHYQHGMVTDLFNHSQPALVSRAAYERTSGWEGFEEFLFAGADCDIFTKVEEVAPVVLLDEVLLSLSAQRQPDEPCHHRRRRLRDVAPPGRQDHRPDRVVGQPNQRQATVHLRAPPEAAPDARHGRFRRIRDRRSRGSAD